VRHGLCRSVRNILSGAWGVVTKRIGPWSHNAAASKARRLAHIAAAAFALCAAHIARLEEWGRRLRAKTDVVAFAGAVGSLTAQCFGQRGKHALPGSIPDILIETSDLGRGEAKALACGAPALGSQDRMMGISLAEVRAGVAEKRRVRLAMGWNTA
jgi:hypothetical protein